MKVFSPTGNIQDMYRIVADPQDPKKWCVELLSPCSPFNEIILSYGKVSIGSHKDSNSVPKFVFETDLVYVPERLRGVSFPDEYENDMYILLGKILFDILDKNLDKIKIAPDTKNLYLEFTNDQNK